MWLEVVLSYQEIAAGIEIKILQEIDLSS